MFKHNIRSKGAVLLLALVLAGCGSISQAQSGNVGELPTAPPAPTWAPVAEPVIPDAPQVAAPSKAPIKYADSFDKTSSDWQVFDVWNNGSSPSTWAVKNNKLYQVSGPDGNLSINPTLFYTGDSNWTDYTVQAQAYSFGNTVMGLVGRVSDEGFYVITIGQQGTVDNNLAILQRYDAKTESYTNLASSDTFGWKPETWNTLQLSFSGDTINVSVNGTLLFSAQDSTLKSGRAGVYGYGESNLVFDNFIVQ